jgi:hypothetical protein
MWCLQIDDFQQEGHLRIDRFDSQNLVLGISIVDSKTLILAPLPNARVLEAFCRARGDSQGIEETFVDKAKHQCSYKPRLRSVGYSREAKTFRAL